MAERHRCPVTFNHLHTQHTVMPHGAKAGSRFSHILLLLPHLLLKPLIYRSVALDTISSSSFLILQKLVCRTKRGRSSSEKEKGEEEEPLHFTSFVHGRTERVERKGEEELGSLQRGGRKREAPCENTFLGKSPELLRGGERVASTHRVRSLLTIVTVRTRGGGYGTHKKISRS